MADKRKGVVKRILKQLKKYRLLLVLTVLFAIITVAGTLLVPVIFGRIIDLVDLENLGSIDFAKIGNYFVYIGIAVAITCLSQWLMSVINNAIAYNVVKDIREEAFVNLQRLPLKYIDGHPYGDLVGRAIADVDQFADGLLMGFTQLFTGVLTVISTLTIMFVINWVIALVVFIITPLSLFVAKFIASRTYSMFRKTSEIRGEQTAFIDEMVGNLKVVQAFNHEDENLEKFDEINERLTSASLKSIFFSSLTNPSTRFVNSVVYAAVALTGAIMLVLGTPLPVLFTVGKLSNLLFYANQYTKPFNEISGVITELQNAIACAGRIYEVIDEQPQQPDKENAVELTDVKGEVRLENIDFSYAPESKLIENLNLNVKAGQRVAIVGPTGCGKTTLINLLMRFYEPLGGQISVDGTPVTDITRKSLRKNYGMVLQDTWLKSGTVRENIAMGRPDATYEEIVEAAKASHAHSFILQLADGYNTVIAEDGGNLSQGQKQLLCISRIMLCLPPMLILDEATSSIDTRTELKIQNAFAKLMSGRTSFVVAHRLSTIKEADIILVMKDGKIIEQGTHSELLKSGGFYNNLYNSQFAEVS
ncbi:MAG: ABC transporter ATP-binding protein [Clostridiales bacterium]|nr:ABC transporter ATP-binding protein [Clostridiales bacterium]